MIPPGGGGCKVIAARPGDAASLPLPGGRTALIVEPLREPGAGRGKGRGGPPGIPGNRRWAPASNRTDRKAVASRSVSNRPSRDSGSSDDPSAPLGVGLTDEEAVSRVVGGKGAVFGVLVERYQDRLYNTIFRLSGSPEDARDLLQDTFVKAYENLEGFRGGSSLYTWLFRIAVNTALSHRRRKKPVQAMPASGAEDGDPAAGDGWPDRGATDPADPLMAAEAEGLIQQAIAELDEDHRAVVVLRDIQHCDYRQVADILELTPGTVKSRLHRARLVLRDKLKPMLKKAR
jgi:RNA polymerase sigma-70 factor, ECF subfamily